jgi:hypothetical protein
VERTGWAPRFGNGEADATESFADHQTWIEGKLDDRFYGGMFPSISRLKGRLYLVQIGITILPLSFLPVLHHGW